MIGKTKVNGSKTGLVLVGIVLVSFAGISAKAASFQGLGDLPGGSFASYAQGVSADDEAFIWDAANGMRSLKDVLENDFGLDLPGWTLECVRGISDGGSTIVGTGNNPYGDNEAWIATLTCDYELAGDMNDDCRVDFLDIALMAGNWLINCSATPADPACIPK